MSNSIDVADQIFRIMGEMDMTIKQLSVLSGIDVSTIYKYKKREHKPTMKQVKKIANAMSVEVEEIIGEVEVETRKGKKLGKGCRGCSLPATENYVVKELIEKGYGR